MRNRRTSDDAVELQLRSILELADRMVVISDKGLEICDDDGCLLLNGLVREYADRLGDAAAREREVHATRGRRDSGQVGTRPGEKNIKCGRKPAKVAEEGQQ